MVLVSFVLVVVAAITLVIGLLQSGLSIIYVSIACSLAAGVVLFTAVLRGRPAPSGVGGGPVSRPAPQGRSPEPAPAAQWSAPQPAAAPAPSPAPAPEPAAVGAGGTATAVAERDDRTEALDRDEIADAVAARGDFPIHDYDSLRATEVLPMLRELSDEQLEAVKDREEAGKNRLMILNRIDSEKQRRQSEGDTSDAWKVDEADWEPAPAPEPEPEPEPVAAPERPATPLFAAARAKPAEGSFPIADYDDLKALEVLGRLSDLSVSELQIVRQREQDGLRRAMVLNRIDRLVEEAPPEPPPAPAKRRAPARSAKAASPRRGMPSAPIPAAAPAKAPAAKRQARVAKEASSSPAVPSPRARKAAAAKKAPKAAQVREAPAPRAPRAAKKAAAVKSTVAKKAAPARKATKKR